MLSAVSTFNDFLIWYLMRFFKWIAGLQNFLKEDKNNMKKINDGKDTILGRIEYGTVGPRNLVSDKMVAKVSFIRLI